MNTRPILSAALAAGVLFASAPMQAQAPAPSIVQSQQAKIAALQAQVNALQAQVKRLQAQLRASSPSGVISPFYKVPNIQIPDYKIAPFQNPNLFQNPGIQGFGGQGFGGQGFGGQGQPPQILVPPQPYSNIPPCTITLIHHKTP